MGFKSGFVTIIGKPNVGKSTLLNLLTGCKVAIMSKKPQTTRNTIKSVITTQNYQIIFIDTPGIHNPRNKLGNYMINVALDAIKEVDIVLFMVEAIEDNPDTGNRRIIEELKSVKTPVILLINKIDKIEKKNLLLLIDKYKELYDFEEIIPISALDIETKDIVLDAVKKLLPEGPRYFPEDMLTDQPERVLIQEFIREKLLNLLDKEIPHGIGVKVISFKKRDNKDIIDINAVIYCEKESHKGIIIGKKGFMLKKVGMLAREEIENLLGFKVFLQLWVKVKEGWRNSDYILGELGYKNLP